MKNKHCILPWFLVALSLHAAAQIPNAKKTYREQAFLHTDRNCYLAGETVWMKMYTVNDDTTDGFHSAIGYIDLYNESSRMPSIQAKLLLDSLSHAAGTLEIPDSLPTGSYRLRAYTRNMEQYGLFYEKNIRIVNTFEPVPRLQKQKGLPPPVAYHLQASTSAGHFGKRQPVKITINSFDDTHAPVMANLSAAVYRMDALQSLDTPDIRQLAVPQQSHYLSKDTVHLPEPYNQVLTGRITDKKTGAPLQVPVMITITGQSPRFYCIPTTRDGDFSLDLQGYSGNADIIVQAYTLTHNGYLVTVYSPFADFTPPRTPASFTEENSDSSRSNTAMDASLQHQLLENHIGAQVWQTFYGDSLLPAPTRFRDTTFFFTKPEEEVMLDDYTRFTTVEEVFREFIKTVMVRKYGDTLHLHVLNNQLVNPKFFDTDPLILLDGVPVFDNKRIFALNPLQLRKVSVMAHKAFYPGGVFNGVVSIQTYAGDMAGYKLDPNAMVADYSGTELPLQFYAPNYAQKNVPSMPDQRNTLYWNPAVQTDSNGNGAISFYTGDEPGVYCLVLQGLSAQGKPCYTFTTFTVE